MKLLRATSCRRFLLLGLLLSLNHLYFAVSNPVLASGQIPSGKEVVSPAVYSSLDPAARGSSFQIAVVLKIRNGFHINAHEASAEYLIPTNLTPAPPTGFKTGDVVYPKGELRTFTFSKVPLNVYEDKIILRMPVTIAADAPIGSQHIPLKLRYQACSSEVCLPPVKLDLDAGVSVAAAADAARPAHRELFRAQ